MTSRISQTLLGDIQSPPSTTPPLISPSMRRLFAGAGALALTFLSWPTSTFGFTGYRNNVSNRQRGIIPAKSQQDSDSLSMPSSESRWGEPPYLAVLTEPDACTSIVRVEETIRAIDQATLDSGVNLVVVRVADGSGNDSSLLKWALLKSLSEMKRKNNFLLVVNDDVEIVRKAMSQNITVDGVHVKEHKAHLIPSIRSELEHAVTCSFKQNDLHKNIIIGTSCHSIESAKKSYQLSPRGPDYLFVGTCYLTKSHPEKQSLDQLEGPSLPGRVKQELYQTYNNEFSHGSDMKSQPTSKMLAPPVIFAIGGIDEQNCYEPVATFGADGVATIRAVMCASSPREIVQDMKKTMANQIDD